MALARTFDLPLLYFFVPPADDDGSFRTPDATAGWPWEFLCMLVWGHTENFGAFADQAAPWAHASTVLINESDMLDDGTERSRLAGNESQRQRLTPDDILAAALNGVVRRRLRGSAILAKDREKPAETLRALADVLDAFENYPPGTFFDSDELREVAWRRRRDAGEG